MQVTEIGDCRDQRPAERLDQCSIVSVERQARQRIRHRRQGRECTGLRQRPHTRIGATSIDRSGGLVIPSGWHGHRYDSGRIVPRCAAPATALRWQRPAASATTG
jgi:hypothetical protein